MTYQKSLVLIFSIHLRAPSEPRGSFADPPGSRPVRSACPAHARASPRARPHRFQHDLLGGHPWRCTGGDLNSKVAVAVAAVAVWQLFPKNFLIFKSSKAVRFNSAINTSSRLKVGTCRWTPCKPLLPPTFEVIILR